MIHTTAIFEDTVIVAAWTPDCNWQVTISDNVTGKSFQKTATAQEFSALMTLALGFCKEPRWQYIVPEIYAIIEPWLVGTPSECRPIP